MQQTLLHAAEDEMTAVMAMITATTIKQMLEGPKKT
jgi:hypothetical protein